MGLIPANLFQRVAVGPGSQLFDPRALPHLELYNDSRLGVSGANGSTVSPYPDKSGNGRDGANDTAFGNSGVMTLATNISPNGQQAVRFSGLDYPSAPTASNALPNPWPTVARGYTLYVGFKGKLATNSNPPIQIIWNDGTIAHYRWGIDAGGKWFYFDEDQVIRSTNTAFAAGDQSAVLCNQTDGILNMYVNGVVATWQAGWNQVYNVSPLLLNGYMLGNLSTNHVVGWNADDYWFLWYSAAHNAATRSLVDNFMRGRFGLARV